MDIQAYKEIVVSREWENNFNTNVQYKNLGTEFKRAANGENMITQEVANKALPDDSIMLHRRRYTPTNQDAEKFKDVDSNAAWGRVVSQTEKRAGGENLSAEEEAQFEKDLEAIEYKTGTPKEAIRDVAKNYEYSLKNDKDSPLNSAEHDQDYIDIQKALYKSRSEAGLSSQEQQELDNNIDRYMAKNNIEKTREEFVKDLNSDAEKIRANHMYKPFQQAWQQFDRPTVLTTVDRKHVMMPDEAQKNAGVWRLDEINGKPVPNHPDMTEEQQEYLAYIHELEHAGSNDYQVDKTGNVWETSDVDPETPLPGLDAAREADADFAVVRTLRESGDDHLADYYLSRRNVESYVRHDYSHATVSQIRYYEQTGQQISPFILQVERAGLSKNINDKMTDTPIEDRSVGQVMTATQDFLDEDRELRAKQEQGETLTKEEEAKLLTPVQKAEAEMFLEDAQALGYEPEPLPVAPSNEQEFAMQGMQNTAEIPKMGG